MSTPRALQTFADWVATIRGDEDSEAQAYVNPLLQAWGWAASVEAGTTFERKIPKGSLAGGLGKADALIEGTWADGHKKALGLPGPLHEAGQLITTSIDGNGAPRLPSFTHKKPCNLGFLANGSLIGSDRGLLGRRADGLSGQAEASQQSNASSEKEEATHANKGLNSSILAL